MEDFQAKVNTSVERKAKESQEIREADSRGWDNFLFTDECSIYLFQYPNPKNDIVWGSQECYVPPAFQVKQSAKVMVRGWHDGSWAHKVTHTTHRPNLNF